MEPLTNALIFGAIVSGVSLAAILMVRVLRLDRIGIKYQLALASGVFIGIAFLGALPRIVETGDEAYALPVFLGFIAFSLLELSLGYHEHHHIGRSHLGIMNLTSDLLHNFIDGIFIYTAFAIDYGLGVTISLATVLHEVPQEVSDFIILINSGFSYGKAVILNLAVSLSTILGILIFSMVEVDTLMVLGFIMGNYLYLAAVDLIPEVSRETSGTERLKAYLFFALGIVIIYLLHTYTN